MQPSVLTRNGMSLDGGMKKMMPTTPGKYPRGQDEEKIKEALEGGSCLGEEARRLLGLKLSAPASEPCVKKKV